MENERTKKNQDQRQGIWETYKNTKTHICTLVCDERATEEPKNRRTEEPKSKKYLEKNSHCVQQCLPSHQLFRVRHDTIIEFNLESINLIYVDEIQYACNNNSFTNYVRVRANIKKNVTKLNRNEITMTLINSNILSGYFVC